MPHYRKEIVSQSSTLCTSHEEKKTKKNVYKVDVFLNFIDNKIYQHWFSLTGNLFVYTWPVSVLTYGSLLSQELATYNVLFYP